MEDKVLEFLHAQEYQGWKDSEMLDLSREEHQLIKAFAEEQFPDIEFDCISYNKNIQSEPHLDRCDKGSLTYCMWFKKNCKGGHLMVGNQIIRVDEGLTTATFYGSDEMHYTTPMEVADDGYRYALCLFKSKK